MKHNLEDYEAKRRFESTPEPPGRAQPRKTRGGQVRKAASSRNGAAWFVIQRHDARQLHYDFRLELDGTLKSWAVPKGPSLDPSVKRLAVQVEDHPLAYGSFGGRIPEGNYGAGTVEIWDRGTRRPEGGLRAARDGYEHGKLNFSLDGQKLHGNWTLVRRPSGNAKQDQWLLIRRRDDEAVSEAEFSVTADSQSKKASKPVARSRATKPGCPRRSGAPRCTGCVRTWWPKCASKPGRARAWCARRRLSGCAATSRPNRSCANHNRSP